MLRYFIFLNFIILVSSMKQNMIVTWGTPSDFTGYNDEEGVTWEQCLQNCLTTEDCVTVFLDSTGACKSFKMTTSAQQETPYMPPITQTTKEEHVKIGFKVDESLEGCPVGENGPTFGGVQAEGDASTTTDAGRIQNYTITYTGSGWEFKTFSMARCTPGFAFYRRATIDWCIVVGYNHEANTSYSRRSYICNQYSKSTTVTPSGIESAGEVEGMVYQLCKLEGTVTYETFSAFLDIQRTDDCQLTPKTEHCMSIDGFNTVDKTVTNLDAYQFLKDASDGADEGRQCGVMIWDYTVAGTNGGKKCGERLWDNFKNGKVDFVECEGPYPYPIQGVICGHEAFS